MRILVLSEGVPSRIGGGRSRQFNLIKSLSRRHNYTVMTFGSAEESQAIAELQRICEEVVVLTRPPEPTMNRTRAYYRITGWKHTLLDSWPNRGHWLITPDTKEMVRDMFRRKSFDLVQVHQGYIAPLMPNGLTCPTLLDMHDVLSDHERRVFDSARGFGFRVGAFAEWRKMRRFERQTLSRFDACTVVSDHDRCSVIDLASLANPIVVPNGVDTDYFQPVFRPSDATSVLFIGSMNYSPNESGLLHFFKFIWPRVRIQVPEARLSIVGTSPPTSITEFSGKENITVIGEVPDVRPYFEQAAVSICPIYTGSGTRLKILDGWAMGKAIVSTSLGAEGLDAEHETNILLADTDEAFARCVVRLLQDAGLRYNLGDQGRNMVEKRYSWHCISEQLETAYESATQSYETRNGNRGSGWRET